MHELVQYLFSGITTGAVYAVIAVGLSMLYSSTELINFAHGDVLMVVLDGRRSGSRGVTLGEMGYLMVSLGAEQAFNLDGGGSSVMARFDKRTRKFVVANKPSDGRQRPATQAFAAFQVKPAP